MMKPVKSSVLRNVLLVSALTCASVFAGDAETTTTTVATTPAASESRLSGTLNFDLNSHFVSYGADVWKDGSSMSEPTFNPSLELRWALTDDLSLSLGTWWDVNSKGGGNSSPIGGRVQEIDVWYGLSYTFGDLTAGVTYNQWFFGSETEDSIDVKFAYDTFLAPSLTIHQRIDPGASGGDDGTVLVLGLAHNIEAGPVTVSFPLNIAYFTEEGFHGSGPVALGGSDSGFGYGSIGATASVPIGFISEDFGSWTARAGVTYYVTSRDVIPGNPKGDFLTANIGVGCSF